MSHGRSLVTLRLIAVIGWMAGLLAVQPMGNAHAAVTWTVSAHEGFAFDAATGDTVLLTRGAGTLSAVRDCHLCQTAGSSTPIPCRGFSRQLTFNIVADSPQDRNFSNDATATLITPVYAGYGKPAAATLSTGNYVMARAKFGRGADAGASNVHQGSNSFLIGGIDSPTAVTLRDRSASASPTDWDGLSVLMLAVWLRLGLGAWWVARRILKSR